MAAENICFITMKVVGIIVGFVLLQFSFICYLFDPEIAYGYRGTQRSMYDVRTTRSTSYIFSSPRRIFFFAVMYYLPPVMYKILYLMESWSSVGYTCNVCTIE